MGWLDWLPDTALATNVNVIVRALDAKADYLLMMSGAKREKPGNKPDRMSSDRFRSFAQRHNSTFKKREAAT